MSATVITLLVASLAALSVPQSLATGGPLQREVIAEIRVHGNQVSADEDVIRLAGVEIGAPFGSQTLEEVRTRLRQTGRFEDVQVLKRFASIADPSRIVVVIIVDEGPVRLDVPDDDEAPIGVVRRRGLTGFMLMPVVSFEDGYGMTYGARVAYAGVGTRSGRLSFPLTWGGTRQVAAEYDLGLRSGLLSRFRAGTAIEERRNPAFEEDDRRRRLWVRAERALGPVRAGGGLDWQRVEFAGAIDRVWSAGLDVVVDTRVDPTFPRDAVYAKVGWTRLHVDAEPGRHTSRWEADVRGYLGLVGQTVLVGRVESTHANQPLPRYLQPLLGGWSTLRGFRAGAFAGDSRLSGSAELRAPLSSPLSPVKAGVTAFVDGGAAWLSGERLADQRFETGVGVGAWITMTALHAGFAVTKGIGSRTRFNAGVGLDF